jgi:hypothetical protein
MKYLELGAPSRASVGGWGEIVADPNVTVEAFFRGDYLGNYYEAGVPATVGGMRAVLPFDFTTFAPTGGQIITGFAIANLDRTTTATVVCTPRSRSVRQGKPG